MYYKITRKQARELQLGLDIPEDDLRTDYSGRGMYGDQCFGVVINREASLDESQVVFELAVVVTNAYEEEDAFDAIERVRDALQGLKTKHDSMGLDQIIYWPNVTVTDDDE